MHEIWEALVEGAPFSFINLGVLAFGVGVIIDRAFYFQEEINAWLLFDCGLAAENIMLLATDYGLGTITQAQSVQSPDILRKVLGIPDSKLFVIGIAIGYPDDKDPINNMRTEREPLESMVKWCGF